MIAERDTVLSVAGGPSLEARLALPEAVVVRGERVDVEAALDHLVGLIGGGPLLLAGYSFGAAMAGSVAAQRRGLAGLALIAPPLAMRDLPLEALAAVAGPVLVVAGTAVHTIEGADHFFFGKLFPLGEAIGAWAREALGAARPS